MPTNLLEFMRYSSYGGSSYGDSTVFTFGTIRCAGPVFPVSLFKVFIVVDLCNAMKKDETRKNTAYKKYPD